MSQSSTHVLFDLDGVLLDTERLYTEATQAIVGRFGKTFTWDIKRDAMGRDADLSARIVLERLGVPLTSQEFLAERGPILESLVARCQAMEGAEAFVRTLVAQGVPVAVATSSDRRLYELKVRPHAWFDLFSAVVCGDDPRVGAKKPAPDIFLVAARDLGAEPPLCLVFEDSLAGVEAALRAGMRVVALPDAAAGPEHGQHFRSAHHVLNGWGEASMALLRG
ncbi:MAG TPA: HAD-IA family hydrolase [Polyangiaceae bacterium]|jgi:pseudouridine-5'-monophosphatase|nr:HAD-IA family hydrolase [Polyangiaceae bacterium]